MNTKQPEALRMAKALESYALPAWPSHPAAAAAELRRLHADNETLRCKLQTLEKLGAAGGDVQPYDQQAMGLCHVCGWKGVIDYHDGPVCVACEHDKTLSPQPTAQAQDALKQVCAIAVSAAKTNSRDIADWREDIDRIAAIAAQQGGA